MKWVAAETWRSFWFDTNCLAWSSLMWGCGHSAGRCVKVWRSCLCCSWCRLINSSWSCWRRRRGRCWWSRWERDQPPSTSAPSRCRLSTTSQVRCGDSSCLQDGSRLAALWRVSGTSAVLVGSSTASASVNIGQLEQQLILLLEPRRIRQTLIELHGMAERPFWRVNSKVRGWPTDRGA